MLTIFRRHQKNCKAEEYDRSYRRCCCPIHIEGKCGEEFVCRSLHTANWEKAQLQVATAEGHGWWNVPPPGSKFVKEPLANIAELQDRFISNATNVLKLSAPTLRKYDTTFKRLTAFTAARGLTRLSELDVELLRDWQASWKLGPRTIQKEIERVRSFFKFCHQAKYIEENPALLISGPRR